MEWKADAICRGIDPGEFYPEGYGAMIRPEVLQLCWSPCPVRERCESHGLTHPEMWGWWGGRSPQWLREARARRRRVAARRESWQGRRVIARRRRRIALADGGTAVDLPGRSASLRRLDLAS